MMEDNGVVEVSDEERVARAVAAIAAAADTRNWAALRALFADEVDFDYTSVVGGAPARLKADAIVAGWTEGLSRYQSTKHNFSDINVVVEGQHATATFTGQATHLKANGERWSCGGDYHYRFTNGPDGWKISAATFTMTWEHGTR